MTDMDYRNYPKTIGEIRSDKEDNATAWSPRDALIDALRDYDSGLIKTDTFIIMWLESCDDAKHSHTTLRFKTSYQIRDKMTALLSRAKHYFLSGYPDQAP